MAFAVALLATSCSQDELLDDGGTEEVPVTFTATVDYAIEIQGDDTAGNMKQAATRATSTEDDAPSRFYAQAVSNGTLSKVVEGTKIDENTYSFTLQVAKDTESDYMFWADNATDNEPTDLRSVPYTMGYIAFAATAQGTPETVGKTVELKHVVAKVTLKTTTDVTSEYSKNISLTASCASTYNVLTASASDFSDKNASKEMTDEGFAANSEVLTTYIIPNPDDKAVTFSAHDLAQTIDLCISSPIRMSPCKATCRKAIPNGERQKNMLRSKSTTFSKRKMVLHPKDISMVVSTDFIYRKKK